VTQSWDVPSGLVPVARAIFGERLPVVEEFASLLANEGTDWGLLGPREVPRLWDRHVLNCVCISEFVSSDGYVADLGSGAGLPGIPLGIAREDVRVDLVEPMERRALFLDTCVERLGLKNVRVVRTSGEEFGARAAKSGEVPDYVTCRALSSLSSLLVMTARLVPPGVLLAIKGAKAADEVSRARVGLRSRGLAASIRESFVSGFHLGSVVEVAAGSSSDEGRGERTHSSRYFWNSGGSEGTRSGSWVI
jgi:16S rRNA (guanine527-N7)-methyltransferase